MVKLTFQPDKVDDFLGVFNEQQEHIASFEGCEKLELLEDIERDNVFFTSSEWIDKEALDNYRNSDLFLTTWSKTKLLFSEKPEAWSLNIVNPE